jgi:hypothetical protein
MPLLDYLKIYRDDLRPLLADDEEPLVMVPVWLAYGTHRIKRPLSARARRTRDGAERSGRRSALDVVLSVFDPAWRWNNLDWDRVLGGVTVSGPAGSWAHRLAAVVDDAPGAYAVVTHRRLLVARRQDTQGFTAVSEVPRRAVAGARRQGRGYSRGRVVVEFADSSTVALHAGFFGTGRADGLVRALDQWGGPGS